MHRSDPRSRIAAGAGDGRTRWERRAVIFFRLHAPHCSGYHHLAVSAIAGRSHRARLPPVRVEKPQVLTITMSAPAGTRAKIS